MEYGLWNRSSGIGADHRNPRAHAARSPTAGPVKWSSARRRGGVCTTHSFPHVDGTSKESPARREGSL